MCLNPKWIYKTGRYKKTNYRGIEGDFYEIGTYTDCGSCEICQNKRSNEWVIRNYYEARRWDKIAFITLTYADNPFFLVKKDGQNFMKRLRRRIEYDFEKRYKSIKGTELYKQLKREFNEENGIRMYMVGEYGSKGRPHLHYIIYNFSDIEAKYLNINKKGNLYYKSKIIEEAWGLGRTSYQEFSPYEIPYISLYETPKEAFKRAYKMTFEKAKKLKEQAHRFFSNKKQRKHWIDALVGIQKKLKKQKEEYYAIKEYNSWSLSIGWEEFYKEYAKEQIHDWKVYIEDKEFVVPTSWVKKLANMGHIDAAEEMLRREREMPTPSESETIERAKNQNKLVAKKKEEVLKHHEKDERTQIID